MAICEAYKPRVPSWYPLTIDVFVKFLHAVSFLNLCTYQFDIMECIMRFLHLDNCRRYNALLPLTLLAQTITRPCLGMRELGLESGARWTRRSPYVSNIGAAKGSTRWLSSPTLPIESYLNKKYLFPCFHFQFPSNKVFSFNREFLYIKSSFSLHLNKY